MRTTITTPTFLDKVDKTQHPFTIILWMICFYQVHINDDSQDIVACIIRLVFWILTFAFSVKVHADWKRINNMQ